jgi:hypothetical protein
MPTAASSQLVARCVWTIRERDGRTGLVVAQKRVHNLLTNYGLTALASGMMPSTLYLAVENPGFTVDGTFSAGVTSISTSAPVHQSGDTQLVLSVGLSNQEMLTFSSSTTNIDGSCTYTLTSSSTQPHNNGEIACRNVSVTDTMTNVVSEQQYDSTNFPGQRLAQSSGYSGGVGNWVYQFYFIGPDIQTTLTLVGMTDNVNIGQGNLLNHFILGYIHNNPANDLEIDGSLTISNA